MPKRFNKLRSKAATAFVKLLDKVFPFVYRLHEKAIIKDQMAVVSNVAYVISPKETLSAIEKCIRSKSPGAYMRFGDGDVYLAAGKKDAAIAIRGIIPGNEGGFSFERRTHF